MCPIGLILYRRPGTIGFHGSSKKAMDTYVWGYSPTDFKHIGLETAKMVFTPRN